MNKKSKIERCDFENKIHTDICKFSNKSNNYTTKQMKHSDACLDKLKHKLVRNHGENKLENKVRHLLMQDNIFKNKLQYNPSNAKLYQSEQINENTSYVKKDTNIGDKIPHITILIGNDVFIANKEGFRTLYFSGSESTSRAFAKLFYDLFTEFYHN